MALSLREEVIEIGEYNEKSLNNSTVYAILGVVIFVAITISEIFSLPFFRGLFELVLAVLAFAAYEKTKSSMIQQVLTIVGLGLAILGLYDISIALR